MGKGMKLNSEVLRIIDAAVNKAAQESAKLIKQQNPETERNYFRETEILLYNYPALKLKVAQDEEFLYDPDASSSPAKRSKDIAHFSSRNVGSHGLDINGYTQGLKSSMMRTRQEVLRIDRALEVIKDDKYYDIIPFKYWDGISMEDIAEKLECDDRTIYRNKNRLVNKIKIMLFGADALR
jgi:DNA-directed RNA polymerase specialized sigma24 family protein